jgi:hypothetical protein
MSKPKAAKTHPQKKPYVKPSIFTLKVDPSLASSPDIAPDPSRLPAETETRQTKAKAKKGQS